MLQLFSRKALARALWLALFSAVIEPTLAQQPFSYPLAPDEIPSKEVYRIVQDKEGYIWLGCNAGLFRYEGAAFKQYSNAEMSGRALSNLEIDVNGKLWCSSFTGQIFRVENDSLKLFVDWSSKQKQFPSFGTSQDGVWLSSDNGIYHASDNGKTTYFKLPDSERQEIDMVFLDDEDNVVTYFRGTGFHRLNSTTGQAIPLSFPAIFATFSEGRCYFTYWKGMTLVLWQQVSNGKSVWLEIKEDHVALFEGFQTEQITSRVNRICSDRQNRLWVCTNAGAMVFDGSETKTYFPDQRVSDVIEDREGTLWFTTLDNGILAMPSIGIRTYGKALFGEKLTNTTSLTLDASGQILMGSFDGAVITFNPKSGTFRPFLEPKNGMHRTVERLQFEGGKLLAARGSFSTWKNGQIEEISVGGNAKDFVRWKGDTILIATVLELAKLHPTADRKWERKQLREGFCRKVAITSKGEIWAAFKDGVYYGNDKSLDPFVKDGKPVFAADIQIDSLDNVWIATISNGLFKVSDGKVIEEFSSSNGLGSNNLHCIALANDTVWIAHANGLDRFINGKFTHFGLLDGMPLKEVNDMLVSNGNVYLASHNGLTVVPSASIPTNAPPPKLITNAISLGDSLVSKSENASYNYTFNELKVDLSVLAFRSRGACKVKYRLIGLDTTWMERTGNHIEIVYNALPAGNFQFEAFALNEDGVQSEEMVSFSFTINPPFWQMWWFYLLVAVLSIALVSGLFLLRIRYINRKAALEHAVVTSKLTALRSQMNPHFLFNALNSIQELVLSKDTKNAIRYLGTFSGLTRTILENSAKETVRLSEEIDMLNQYLELEKLRFGDTLEISMVIDPEIDAQGIRIPPMLIQPYVENALKHGLLHLQENRKLVLEFEENGGLLQVTIEDNGVGRAKAEEFAKQKKKHQSFSSEATENRLLSMKNGKGISGMVEVVDLYKDGEAAGTKVVLKIPYLQS